MQHVMSQLITKKGELLGELNFYKLKVQQLKELINSIDISINVFDPSFDIKQINPKRYSTKKHYFKHGESHIMILDTLRQSQHPLNIDEITLELMKRKGLDYENMSLFNNIQQTLRGTLKKQEKNKIIKKEKGNGNVQWAILT